MHKLPKQQDCCIVYSLKHYALAQTHQLHFLSLSSASSINFDVAGVKWLVAFSPK